MNPKAHNASLVPCREHSADLGIRMLRVRAYKSLEHTQQQQLYLRLSLDAKMQIGNPEILAKAIGRAKVVIAQQQELVKRRPFFL